MWVLIVIGGLGLAIGAFVAMRGRNYARIFSSESFREFHQKLSVAITAATSSTPKQPLGLDNGTAFVTSIGLAGGVTSVIEKDRRQRLHISLSLPSQVTTHTVCSRFAFFAIVMFGGAKAALNPYYTESGVHHLQFHFEIPFPELVDFDTAYARYLKDYRQVPFQFQRVKSG